MCKFVLLKYLMRQNCRKHFINNVLLVSPHSQPTIRYSVLCYFSVQWRGKNETKSRSECCFQQGHHGELFLPADRGHPAGSNLSDHFHWHWPAAATLQSGQHLRGTTLKHQTELPQGFRPEGGGTLTGGATVGSNIQQRGVETQRIDW